MELSIRILLAIITPLYSGSIIELIRALFLPSMQYLHD